MCVCVCVCGISFLEHPLISHDYPFSFFLGPLNYTIITL